MKHFIFLWVRSTLLPKNIKKDLGINPDKPICYVLRTFSFKDAIVLDYHCTKNSLPRPISSIAQIKETNTAGILFLNRPGVIQEHRSSKLPSQLSELVKTAHDGNFDVQIVPISIFWGRNPGKEEKSLFKLLFFDDKYGGFFQRFITFFVHGRNVFCNFGKPISLTELLSEGLSKEDSTKKLRRLLKIHFRKVRDAIVGPYIYDRNQVISAIISDPSIKKLIEKEATKSGAPLHKIEKRARKYANEVCSNASPSIIRFFDILFSWLWKKVYTGLELHNESKLRELSEEHVLVYMPCHKSHMDYLLIGYLLYYLGVLPPHTVAGNNLNFWPVGYLLKGGGGIFIRRTFRGDRLYGAIVNAFMQYLIRTGFPLCFYPEGGRSRTGFLLPPKLGILSMVVESVRKETKKPILLVPIYLAYDKLLEGETFVTEMRGKRKKSESIFQLLRTIKIIKKSAGKAYIGFGQPLKLTDFLNTHYPDWRNLSRFKGSIVRRIANEISTQTNCATVVTPVSLFSLILLSTPKKALNENDLVHFSSLLVDLGKKLQLSSYVNFPLEESLGKSLKDVEKLGHLEIFKHPDGNIAFVDESKSSLLTYYRNNILHIFSLSSMIACFLNKSGEMNQETLIKHCKVMYKFIKNIFFLPWDDSNIDEAIIHSLKCMAEKGLIELKNNNIIKPPQTMSKSYVYFTIFNNMTEDILKKYALYGGLFGKYIRLETFNFESFKKKVQEMSKRLSILNGMSESTLFDSESFRDFFRILTEAKFINEISPSTFKINPKVVEITTPCTNLLGEEAKQCIDNSLFDTPQAQTK